MHLFSTVTNQAAALALARERKVTNPPPRATPLQHSGQPNPAQNCSQSQSQSQGKPDDHVEVSSTDTSPRNRHLVQPHGVSASVNSTGLFPHPNISGSGAAVGKHSQTGGGDSQKHISVLLEKIDWAVTELRGTQSVEYSIQLCQLIKICAETVSSVRMALEAWKGSRIRHASDANETFEELNCHCHETETYHNFGVHF